MIQLDRARRVHLSQDVLEQILAKIRDGSLRPGDRLPSEYELMNQLGVGRSSVREALRGLIALGFVETKPGRGAVVLDPSGASSGRILLGEGSMLGLKKWAILDLLEVRESLEGTAAQLAALRATPVDMAAMERAAQGVEAQAVKGANYFRSNLEFHLAIARASKNSLLVESVRHLLREVRLQRERLVRESVSVAEGDREEQRSILAAMQRKNPATVAEHREILEAIRRKDSTAARQAMVEHIQHPMRLMRESEGVRVK